MNADICLSNILTATIHIDKYQKNNAAVWEMAPSQSEGASVRPPSLNCRITNA